MMKGIGSRTWSVGTRSMSGTIPPGRFALGSPQLRADKGASGWSWSAPPARDSRDRGKRVIRNVLGRLGLVLLFGVAGERDGKAWRPSRGKYVVVWRRHQDTWRMQLDIWNSVEEGAP